MSTRTPPTPLTLAADLERLAKALRDKGPRAVELASLLAARGWPSHSDGASSGRIDPDGDVSLTSVEQAATNPGKWAGIDVRLADEMRRIWTASGSLLSTIADVVAHSDPEATDRPNRQPGSGHCEACGDFCSGAAGDRLRGGLDDKCRKAWERAGQPDRIWWIRRRREDLAEKAPIHVDPTVVGSPS